MTSPSPADDITRYISEVQAVPALSREDELAIAIRAKNGDPAAERALVEANLRHVVAIAIGYRRYGLRLSELISEGNVGLMIALRRFDPERGVRFVTYAAHWIRAYILDYVIRGWSIVGVGAGPLRSKVFFKLRREKARIAAMALDRDAATEKLAEAFGTSAEKITELSQRVEARDVSLDVKPEGDLPSLLDGLASEAPSQEERLSFEEETRTVATHVRNAIGALDPRERYIVSSRLMADAADELSLAEIGRRLGVSRERARQIEARAMAKLRKFLDSASRTGASAEIAFLGHHDEAAA